MIHLSSHFLKQHSDGRVHANRYAVIMDQETFMKIVASILEIDEDSVSATDNLNDIDWDSLATISFIAEIDSALGVSVDADLLARAETVGDLYAVVTEATARGDSAGS